MFVHELSMHKYAELIEGICMQWKLYVIVCFVVSVMSLCVLFITCSAPFYTVDSDENCLLSAPTHTLYYSLLWDEDESCYRAKISWLRNHVKEKNLFSLKIMANVMY